MRSDDTGWTTLDHPLLDHTTQQTLDQPISSAVLAYNTHSQLSLWMMNSQRKLLASVCLHLIITSTPVVDAHMLIAVTANSLQQWPSPSKRRPVSHTVRDAQANLSHRANDRRTCYRFFNFWPLGGLPLGQSSPKGRWPDGLQDLPTSKISPLYANPRLRYPLPKILRTNKQ